MESDWNAEAFGLAMKMSEAIDWPNERPAEPTLRFSSPRRVGKWRAANNSRKVFIKVSSTEEYVHLRVYE